jgi:hypothetical protein
VQKIEAADSCRSLARVKTAGELTGTKCALSRSWNYCVLVAGGREFVIEYQRADVDGWAFR